MTIINQWFHATWITCHNSTLIIFGTLMASVAAMDDKLSLSPMNIAFVCKKTYSSSLSIHHLL
jgi:hypothetical protein